MSSVYQFTEDAEDDLISIWLYTEERYGEQQADVYQDELHAACQRIVDGIAVTRPVEGMAQVQHYACNRHVLFYTSQAERVIVIAVLHERMDLPKQLAERLAKGGT